MDKIAVLIADDHTLFRRGVRKMLEAEEDMEVVGEAATVWEALEQARTLMPDVILMDIRMPAPAGESRPGGAGPTPSPLDGIAATRAIHREMPHIGVVFVTMFQDDESVFRGLQAGGKGYVLKDADPETMLRAIRAVAHGESLLDAVIAQKVLRQFIAWPDRSASLVDDLTPREVEVLKLIAAGRSNKETARDLVTSEKTVKNHINNIFSKLHLYDRTQAMLYAIRKGLVKIDSL